MDDRVSHIVFCLIGGRVGHKVSFLLGSRVGNMVLYPIEVWVGYKMSYLMGRSVECGSHSVVFDGRTGGNQKSCTIRK